MQRWSLAFVAVAGLCGLSALPALGGVTVIASAAAHASARASLLGGDECFDSGDTHAECHARCLVLNEFLETAISTSDVTATSGASGNITMQLEAHSVPPCGGLASASGDGVLEVQNDSGEPFSYSISFPSTFAGDIEVHVRAVTDTAVTELCVGDGCSPVFDNLVRSGTASSLRVEAFALAEAAGGQSTTATVVITVTVSCPAPTTSQTFTWTSAASDAYANPDNWDPVCIGPPVHNGPRSDTAQFFAPGAGSSVSATNATAGRWVITEPVDLNGSARVFSTSTTEPSLVVDNGGSLLLDGGATFESVHTALGTATAFFSSNVTVSGDDSLWKSTGEAIIGDPSEARLIIENGGRVEAVDPNGLAAVLLGKVDGTSGRVEVRGIQNSGTAPSTLRVQLLNVGNRTGNGVGNVLIENGGLVDVVDVGAAFFRGSITVAGQNGSTNGRSTLKAKPTFAIATEPGSQLEVKDGALLNTDEVVVGTDGLTGRILVNNSGNPSLPPFDANVPISGAAWVADGFIQLDGQNGPAELIVEDNGVVTCTGNLLLGQSAGSAGKVSVSDGGSIGVVGDLTVGGSGRGELNINADGRLTSGPATVGSGPDPNSRGRVVISAGQVSDAEWEVTGELTVGGGTRATGLGVFEPFKGEVFLQDSPLFGEPTLSVSGHLFVFAQGAILGNGTLAVPPQRRVVNGGIIAPGLSPGQITIEGDYEQPEGGTLVIEVAGVQPGQFDVLHVAGNATLAGKVDLRFIDGFVPRTGDNIDFVKVDGTITGKLTGAALVATEDGAAQAEVNWEVTEAGTCRLIVTDVHAIDPFGDPTSACGTGLCGAGMVPMLPLMCLGLVAFRRIARARHARVDRTV